MNQTSYIIRTISSFEEITTCNRFSIDHYKWDSKITPAAWGYMGFCPSSGFFIRLLCEEKSPRRTYTKNFDPVYTDSALEAFLQPSLSDPRYLNLEINANGALLAMLGPGRKDRVRVTDKEILAIQPKAICIENEWHVDLIVPLSLVSHYFPDVSYSSGSKLRGNFFKIQQNKTNEEHYASFSPIHSDVPDFHRPDDFADLILE